MALASEVIRDPQLASKIGDLNRLFTNDLIDEVNAFDRNAVIKQAREFVLTKA